VDAREEWGCRKTTVTRVDVSICRFGKLLMGDVPCECVDHAAAGGHDSRGGEQDADEREAGRPVSIPDIRIEKRVFLHQQADGASVAGSGILQDLEEGSRGRLDHLLDITRDEEQDNKEDCTSDSTDTNTGNHNLGSLNRWVGDFYNPLASCPVNFRVQFLKSTFNHVGNTVLIYC
jgi:hypothetical protein